jgi:hypothetical protein
MHDEALADPVTFEKVPAGQSWHAVDFFESE